jgi:hypothetical protein
MFELAMATFCHDQPPAIILQHPNRPPSVGLARVTPWTTSVFMEWKKDSMWAFLVTSRRRFMLCTKPREDPDGLVLLARGR